METSRLTFQSRWRSRLRFCPASPLTYFLFLLLGAGSWLTINGVWAEIPIIFLTLPECRNLPAFVTIVAQVANVGTLTYAIVKFFVRRANVRQIYLEVPTIFLLVAVGMVASILLSIFWSRTVVIRGTEHSVPFIVLSFFFALVDCTSTVVFLPFLKHFPSEYISGLYIGEGLSGVLPSVVALSQGFVNNSLGCLEEYPGIGKLGINFSPSIFFLFLAVMLAVCGVAFMLIITLPTVRKHMVNTENITVKKEEKDEEEEEEEEEENSESSKEEVDSATAEKYKQDRESIEPRERTSVNNFLEEDDEEEELVEERTGAEAAIPLIKGPSLNLARCPDSTSSCYGGSWRHKFCAVSHTPIARVLHYHSASLFCLLLINFLTNGALNSFSSFAFQYYGNTVYHMAVNLGLLANPVACLVYVLVPRKSLRLMAIITTVICILCTYLLVVALLSPHPPGQNALAAKIFIVSLAKHNTCKFNCKGTVRKQPCSKTGMHLYDTPCNNSYGHCLRNAYCLL